MGADRRVLLLLNSDTNEIENIIEPKFENSNYNNGIDTYFEYSFNGFYQQMCSNYKFIHFGTIRTRSYRTYT